jgi:hypothetical protein
MVADSTIAMVVFAAVDFMIASATSGAAYEYPYGCSYYPYGYNDAFYDNGSCYLVQRRVHTTQGWRLQPVRCAVDGLTIACRYQRSLALRSQAIWEV